MCKKKKEKKTTSQNSVKDADNTCYITLQIVHVDTNVWATHRQQQKGRAPRGSGSDKMYIKDTVAGTQTQNVRTGLRAPLAHYSQINQKQSYNVDRDKRSVCICLAAQLNC